MKAEAFLQQKGIHPHSLVTDNDDIRCAVSGLLESYAEQRMKELLEVDDDLLFRESMSYSTRNAPHWINGVQWLLEHLKKKEGITL